MNSDIGTCQLTECSQPVLLLQVFGCVDWAPSDLVTSFLLAGAAQTARRRSQVIALMAAGGAGSVPSVGRRSQGAASVCRTVNAPGLAVCMAVGTGSVEVALLLTWPPGLMSDRELARTVSQAHCPGFTRRKPF